jgi:hypothetical protein
VTHGRAKFLRDLVKRRFKRLSPEEARLAYADGFHFGIAKDTNTTEERKFVEALMKAALDAKLAPKGD